MATKATGKPVASSVKYRTERVLAVKTSNPGSLTACGLTFVRSEMDAERKVQTHQYNIGLVYELPFLLPHQLGCGNDDNPQERDGRWQDFHS